jgi:hypothetical protein
MLTVVALEERAGLAALEDASASDLSCASTVVASLHWFAALVRVGHAAILSASHDAAKVNREQRNGPGGDSLTH